MTKEKETGCSRAARPPATSPARVFLNPTNLRRFNYE